MINLTGRESATILESYDPPNDVKIHETRGFFDLNEVEQGIKLILNGLVFPLIFLGIIVNKLTHRYIAVHPFFSIRIYFIRISRLKFAKL